GIFTAPFLGGTGGDDFSIGSQFMTQLTAVVITVIWSGVVSAILYKLIDVVIGLRASPDAETQGLDIPTHGETAYHS
ncbi:MAG: ammonium transporter, partial [Alphaproteobacteria bacterium]|nr:ammonium transporter [Alphaproteobacteria bacterium]